MKLLNKLEEIAKAYSIAVEYNGQEVVLVAPDGYTFESGTPTEVFSPWDAQPAVAMLKQALASIKELGEGLQCVEVELPSISTEELHNLAVEEKELDNLAQCGAISRHFPELASAILEAKRGLENKLIEEGIELGTIY